MRRTVFTPRGMIVLVMGIVLVAVVTGGTWALDGPAELATIEGLGSIHTILGTTVPDLSARLGALYTDLQTAVESRLRSADIPIEPSYPERFVVVVDIFGEDDRTACRATIDVAIRQFALHPGTLPRFDAPPLSTHRTVWASCAEIDRLVRDNTSDLVDQFITVYLEPKPDTIAGVTHSDR